MDTRKPPLSAKRIMGEIVAGGAGGLLGALLCSWVLSSIFSTGEREDWRGLIALYVFIFVGPIAYMIVSSVGVYLCGNIGNQTGSIAATLAGAFLGGGVGISCIFVWSVLGKSFVTSYLPIAILGFLPSPVGATVAFNLTRRYKPSKKLDGEQSERPERF